ncbi:MAG TPA: ectonucleotide pyrophosphatase/phosphodiesterase [Terracidiphilus sp.]|jgi:predicted AlkP superfamily pyrophosphatase or phosphodiesterase
MQAGPRRPLILLQILFAATVFAVSAHAAPVLMISIDGLKPEYVTQANAHGLKIPYLRSLISNGTYADGVTGVWPTLTYPSHTTLITGVWPAEHGIYSNVQFDPELHYSGAWNWYADEIRVPTLWRAAHNVGLHTASIGWPVSVGTRDVDWLIPEFWRTEGPSSASNPADRLLMAALSHPRRILSELEPVAGPYMMGNDTTIAGDEMKTRYALEILRKYKPALMTLHLSSLDEAEHTHGVFSAEAGRTLEAIDGMVARLAKQQLANDPAAVLLVVSDHGFMNLTHVVNLQIPFLKAGLMQYTADPATKAQTIAWKAQPWMAGGMAAIMLKDPNDAQTRDQVRALLARLAADPANGIAQVFDHDAALKHGAFPDAAFLVVFQAGYYAGFSTSGRLVSRVGNVFGSHGFSPEYPEMRASFFALGSGVAHHRDLGVIDMRQIAPTVAHILGAPMQTAKAPPLHLQP